tara:strand:+ start:17360 stop:17839 length:480 start_codon:yes stop_codon:yes gene_type:complete
MQDVAVAVTAELQRYADKGTFTNFGIVGNTSAKSVEFKFHWLAQRPFSLILKPKKNQLLLNELLPAVPYRSDMDTAFRKFIVQRCSPEIPAHRRLDDKKLSFSCHNHSQNLSVTIDFKPKDAVLAMKTAINFIHEVFNNFLIEGPYQDYMVEVFHVSEE